MAENKTQATAQPVRDFLDKLTDETVRKDCYTLCDLMEKSSGEPAVMWGTAIIGFGTYHYKYDSGREGDMCLVGFSPRSGKIALYVLSGFPGQDEVLAKLGKYKASGGCLYIKKLADVNVSMLEELLWKSFAHKKKLHKL